MWQKRSAIRNSGYDGQFSIRADGFAGQFSIKAVRFSNQERVQEIVSDKNMKDMCYLYPGKQ